MAGERPILIVDDDLSLRETLVEQLQLDGEFNAEEAGSIGEAETKVTARDARFDAVILDVGLPDGDGRDLCASLRRQGMRMPIIMLTGSDDEADVVRGLDSGANDYIAKPFRLAELLARSARPAPHLREQRRRCVHDRALHLPALGQASAGAGEEPAHPADREGGRDLEVPVSRRHQARAPGRCC